MIQTQLLQLCISVSYVLVIYLSTHNVSYKQRNEPQIICQRMKSIVLLCLLNIILVPLVISHYTSHTFVESFLSFGIIPGYHFDGTWALTQSVWDIIRCAALIMLLYIGPITDLMLYYIYSRDNMILDFWNNFNDVWGVRNHIFAPITEELVYTSMLLSVHILMEPRSNLTWTKLLIEPSLYFGIAHIHHAIEMYRDDERSLLQIIIITVFQAIYTTLFGTLSNYVYLRSGGNLWSCVIIHGMCNLLGFPGGSDFSLYLQQKGSVQAQKTAGIYRYWNCCYLLLLLVGLMLFTLCLVPLTFSIHSVLH